MTHCTTPIRIAVVALTTLLALPLAQLASPVEARQRPRTVTRTFSDPLPIEQIAMVATSPVSASPYPAAIFVDGLKGKIRDVNVRLTDLAYTHSADLEALLVGPGGQTAILMADVGADPDVEGVTLRLADKAAPLPTSALQRGTFRPTNASGAAITFNAPAPTGFGTSTSRTTADQQASAISRVAGSSKSRPRPRRTSGRAGAREGAAPNARCEPNIASDAATRED